MLSLKEWVSSKGIPRADKNDDIEEYSSIQSSGVLNSHLQKHNKIKSWNGKAPEEAAKNISNAIKPTTHENTVYTGTSDPSSMWKEHKASTKEPLTVHFHQFLSTSHDIRNAALFGESNLESEHDSVAHPLRNAKSTVAKKQLNPEFKGMQRFTDSKVKNPKTQITHVLKIHIPEGTRAARIDHLSHFPEEGETLLDRGHKIQIHPHPEAKIVEQSGTKRGHQNKVYIWHAKVVGHEVK